MILYRYTDDELLAKEHILAELYNKGRTGSDHRSLAAARAIAKAKSVYNKGRTRNRMASLYNVSHRRLEAAIALLASGYNDLVDQVDSGILTLHRAEIYMRDRRKEDRL